MARSGLTMATALAIGLFAASSATAQTITVQNGHDSGAGSLRQAIADANPGSKIKLPKRVYNVTTSELGVEKSLHFIGVGARKTIVKGGGGLGVFHLQAGPSIPVSFSGMTITGGETPTTTSGAGIDAADETPLTLTRVNVSGNLVGVNGSGSALGGGISANGPLTVIGSTISHNTAQTPSANAFGAGIYWDASDPSTDKLRIVNSTIAANVAKPSTAGSGNGVGINVTGKATIIDSTIVGNSVEGNTVVSNGAGLNTNYSPPTTLTLTNSILAANGAVGGPIDNCAWSTVPAGTGGYNLVQGVDPDDCGELLTGPHNRLVANAKLSGLANHGGQTNTILPKHGSAAINKGGKCKPPKTDQRGKGRKYKACDSGSVEVQPRRHKHHH